MFWSTHFGLALFFCKHTVTTWFDGPSLYNKESDPQWRPKGRKVCVCMSVEAKMAQKRDGCSVGSHLTSAA
ncbi:hypothetical protein BKA57DRAFT_474157 [Linnemannia elongata]|nr:hypothetical protein BKA57DRAFT_474157 [Linnemannia elongata]